MKRLSDPRPEEVCSRGGLPAGFPLAGLLSEPIKIVQAPRLTMVMYTAATTGRSTRTAGCFLPNTACRRIPRLLGWTLGTRHVRGRDGWIQRPDTAGRDGARAQRPAAYRRALPPPRLRHLDVELTFDDPKILHPAVHGSHPAQPDGGRRHLRDVSPERERLRPHRRSRRSAYFAGACGRCSDISTTVPSMGLNQCGWPSGTMMKSPLAT